MSAHASKTLSHRISGFIERATDRIGVFVLLILGVSTAGATLLVGV